MRARMFRGCILPVILALCVLRAQEIQAQTHIKSYKETIQIHKNGSADVQTLVTMGDYAGPTLALPLKYLWVEKISAKIQETGEALPAEIVTVEGMDCLFVSLGAKSVSGKTLAIAFRDPAYVLWKNAGPGEYGLYQHKSEFQNTTRFIIDEYAMEVILPEGFVIHRITRSIPALTKKDPVPPFSFVNLRDGSHLSIAARNLGPGGTCMLEYAFARKKTSYAFLSVCIALMVLCLVCFRDILKEGKDARSHG